MATFDVTVRRLDAIEPHPNADRLDLAVVGGYRAVVARGQFQAGGLIAYIPEAAVLPPGLIQDLGLTGKLAGPNHNRVHAVRLRGALSQGLVIPALAHWREGTSVMEELNITKFEPEIPDELKGSVYALEREEGFSFDVENIKAFPDLFAEGEDVVFTEKIHGVFLGIGACPARDARPGCGHVQGRAWVSSKGLLGDRLAFDTRAMDTPNVYVRVANRLDLFSAAMGLSDRRGAVCFIFGEAFGQGVQDLGYGSTSTAPGFRVFGIVVGEVFLGHDELERELAVMGLARAPVLYRGPFGQDIMRSYTTGRESVSGLGAHIREGIVITPAVERIDSRVGRVAAKSVSDDYVLRKGGTEYS